MEFTSAGSLLGFEDEEKVLFLLVLGLRVIAVGEVVVPVGMREGAVVGCEDEGIDAFAIAVAVGLKNELRGTVEVAREGERPGEIIALELPDGGPRYIWLTSGAPPARGISD